MTVEYEIKYGAEKLITRAKKFAKDNGVNVQGDSSTGTASHGWPVPFKGQYTIKDKELTMVVSEKPWLFSWDSIRDKILEWLRSNDRPD